jgi:hypothetical protein
MRRKQTTVILVNGRPLVVDRRVSADLLDEAEELAALFEAGAARRTPPRAA